MRRFRRQTRAYCAAVVRASLWLWTAMTLAACALWLAACTEDYVTVPAGSFLMGSPETELGRDEDEAQRGVALTHDFEMMTGEVTKAEFEWVMGYDPGYFPKRGRGLNFPIDQVSWFDAVAYANKLSLLTGYTPCYTISDITCADGSPGDIDDACKEHGGIQSASVSLNGVESVYECEGFRLPTEAEWEYAARAGSTTAFPTGEITHTSCTPLDPRLDPIAWYCGNCLSLKSTRPVKAKAPNAWGLYDMAGNVAEWTWDWYEAHPTGQDTDPQGPAAGYFRVVRGGAAWYHGAARLRSADRSGHTPGYRDRFIGFRLVRTASASKAGIVPPVPADAQREQKAAGRRLIAPAPRGGEVFSSSPVDIVRPDVGTPMSPEEIAAFTAKITGFWKDVGYFDWADRVSHGMDASNPYGMPDYKLFWQDVRALKAGDTVTFEHVGFADNLTIPTPKILMGAAALYLSTGDARLARLVEGLCKGMVAGFMGMIFDPEDPERAITARTIFTQDHEYIQEGGRRTVIAYGPAKRRSVDWNAQTIPNRTNPYWGDIWVRNWRSKDDVPHIFRSVPVLLQLAEHAPDASVRSAAATAASTLQKFARDIVDTGYYIRTKDEYGNAYIPLTPKGYVADLASFVEYNFILPAAECAPKLAAALIAYEEPHGIDCGTSFGDLYEYVAALGHYYNYAIIRYFHAAAITNALVAGQYDTALDLLEGMAARVDEMMHGNPPHTDDPAWPADVASYLFVAASSGLPLTSEEARHIAEQYSRSVDHYATWPNWDLWAPGVPDGVVAWEPDRNGDPYRYVEITEMTYPLEYCTSPWRNDTGAALLDCEIVLDPSRWGQGG